MRRFVLLVPLVLVLPGCTGFGTFLTHAFSGPGRNPNRPAADSENVRRAYGNPEAVTPLLPDQGNVWPGPQGPDPTLTDIEQQQNNPQGSRGNITDVPAPPFLPNRQPRGSSTPPGPAPQAPPGPRGVPPQPQPPPGATAAPPPGRFGPGGVVTTPGGNLNDAGGTNSYRQLTQPGGAGAIVVPNGNGTSTVISPDGGVQVIPTPR